MNIPVAEQETLINWQRGDMRVELYTTDSTTITKLDKLVNNPGSEYKVEKLHTTLEGETLGKTYSFPVGLLSFRSKKMSRTMTEEQREQLRKNLAKARGLTKDQEE